LSLPSGTTYLALRLTARENILNNSSGTEFHGHYADDVTLDVVPEASTLALMGLGLAVGLLFTRRRRG